MPVVENANNETSVLSLDYALTKIVAVSAETIKG